MNAEILLSRRAALTPNRVALLEAAAGRRFTYAELEARANQTARWLAGRQVEPGDRVALLAHNSVHFVDLLFACLKIGAIFNPLNWRLAAPELAYILSDSRPKVLIFGPEFSGLMPDLRPALDDACLIPCEGAAGPDSSEPPLEPEVAAQAADPILIDTVGEDDPACLLYTSGTTGRPKGAMLPHRQILWNAINTVISWELTAGDVSPILTPMFHAGGLFVFLTPLFYAGGRVVVARTFDPADSLRLIQKEGCTVILGVPTLFQMWLEAPEIRTADFGRVRWFISGGAPCPLPLLEHWRRETGTVLRQGYGLTEAGTNCFTMTDEEAVAKAGSVGKPIFHSAMRLVDAGGSDVPPGETGELLIQGPHIMTGYWSNAQATAEALRDGWLHTGDMARQDADGFYTIAGRYKDMIISGGENIYAAEVEAVFHEHPGVRDCALIGRPDEKWGEVGLMVVVPADDTVTAEALLAHCAGQLARYKVPKSVVFIDTLPYSPYGKVEKIKLRAQVLGI